MSSSTGSKKELIDFLWDWAESQGDWSKLLVNTIIQTEQALLISERQSIFDYFLQSIKLNAGLPILNITKPKYEPTAKRIQLLSLSEVKGVNKLAENQIVNFGTNVTIIYGENGTGKTGYCRILKALGFSYDPQKIIYNNIATSNVSQSAKITYKSNEDINTHTWNGINRNSDLSTISVFNNNCVQISLVNGRNLIVSPIGFHLFNLISEELVVLNEMLDNAISKKKSNKLSWNVNLNLETPQQIFINSLNAKSTEEKLLELSIYTEDQKTELASKEIALKGLNKELLDANIKSFTAHINELNTHLNKIHKAKETLTKEALKTFAQYNEQLQQLENRAQKGIKEIAGIKGIEFYNTEEFQNFIKSAEKYIKLFDTADYPNNENDVCVYCRQQLTDQNSKELLTNYRQLLNDTTQDDLEKIKSLKAILIRKISDLESDITFNSDIFGINEKNETIQPLEILEYNSRILKSKESIEKNKAIDEINVELDFEKYINFFTSKKILINEKLDQAIAAVNDLKNQENLLKKEIAELKDRKLLSDNFDDIKQQIIYLKVIERLEKNRNKFSTNSISRKTTEAREELVKQNFINIFKDELSHLRKSSIKIDIDFGTVKGNSKVQQRIRSNYNLTEILSEGEQKAIALAEYLTELQLDNSESPIIFDDPVNSLDHHIIDDVARRLIDLSRTRQVVICTHSILLFNSMLSFSKQTTYKDLIYKFYNSKNQYEITGYITEAEEEINKINSELSLINKLINNTPKDRDEHDVASDCYSYLRSAIELFVEYEIFQGTVKRYQKNIALTSFLKVNGALINSHKGKLNEIFERCCGYIKGHSNPIIIHTEPTILEFLEDFNQFKLIRAEFLN